MHVKLEQYQNKKKSLLFLIKKKNKPSSLKMLDPRNVNTEGCNDGKFHDLLNLQPNFYLPFYYQHH